MNQNQHIQFYLFDILVNLEYHRFYNRFKFIVSPFLLKSTYTNSEYKTRSDNAAIP